MPVPVHRTTPGRVPRPSCASRDFPKLVVRFSEAETHPHPTVTAEHPGRSRFRETMVEGDIHKAKITRPLLRGSSSNGNGCSPVGRGARPPGDLGVGPAGAAARRRWSAATSRRGSCPASGTGSTRGTRTPPPSSTTWGSPRRRSTRGNGSRSPGRRLRISPASGRSRAGTSGRSSTGSAPGRSWCSTSGRTRSPGSSASKRRSAKGSTSSRKGSGRSSSAAASRPPISSGRWTAAGWDSIGWKELRLTPEETAEMARISGGTPPRKRSGYLQRQGRRMGDRRRPHPGKGAAGRDRAAAHRAEDPRGDRRIPRAATCTGTSTRRPGAFLVRTAFCRDDGARTAESLTGNPKASRILSYLNRHNLFTEVHPGEEPVYEFHSLFREFLLHQAGGGSWPPKRRAPCGTGPRRYFEDSGQTRTPSTSCSGCGGLPGRVAG